MALTPEQQIAQQREIIERARKQAQELAKREEVSRAQLLKRGMLVGAKARAEQVRRQKYAKERLQQISKAEKAFEAGVKKYEAEKKAYEARAGPSATQLAYEAIKRQAMGKSATGITYGRPDVVKEAERLMRESPELKRAVQRGVSARIAAKEAGFKDVSEFIGVSKYLAPPTLEVPTWEARVATQPPGTYDIVTGSYISPEGVGYTTATPPPGAKLVSYAPTRDPTIPGAYSEIDPITHKVIATFPAISAPEIVLPSKFKFEPAFLQAGYVSPEMRKKAEIQKIDIQAYKGMGFTPSEAQILAEEGWKQKVGFTPEGARQVLREQAVKSAFLQAGYVSPELRKILPPEAIQKFQQQQIQLQAETQRYKEFGYTPSEARKLATASLERGGVTFDPKGAREILRKPIVTKIMKAVEKVAPITEIEFAPAIVGVGPLAIRAPTGVTYGEVAALPARGVEEAAEYAKEEMELGYAIATGYLPEKWRPAKYTGPPGERPITPTEVTEALETGWFEEAEKKGWYEPVTPERVGEIAEKVVGLAPYAVPYVGPAYMASEFFKGVEEYKYPEKEAEKIYKEQDPYKAYLEQYEKAEKDLEEGYELEPKLTRTEYKAEVLPFYTEQVREKGAIGAATSLAFLGAIGLAKAVPAIIRTTVPRAKYLGMTQKQYQAAVKEAEKELVKLGKQDIAWIGKIEEDTKGIYILGEQRLGGLKRDIKVYGELKETELGKVFIPKGKGEITGEGVVLLGKKKIPYQYLEAQKFEVGADAISVRAGELIGHPEVIKELPSKIKLLRESKFMPELLKPEIIKAEEALRGPVRIIPEPLAKAEAFKILGVTKTVPKAGAFALYRVKPKYLTPSAKLERAIKRQMKENIYFGGRVTKDIAAQIAIQLKPKKFLVIGRKEAGVFFVKEAEREVKLGMKVVGGVKTPFAKTFAEVIQKPFLVKLPKVPKPPRPKVEALRVEPQKYIPLMIGGVKFVPPTDYSILFGREVPIKYLDVGLYEVTEAPPRLLPPVIKPVIMPAIDVGIKPRVVTIPKMKLITVPKVGEKFKYETALKLKRVTVPKFKEVLVPRERLRERLIPREALALREIQIQREALRQVPITRPIVVPRPRIPRIKIPKLRIPIILEKPPVRRRLPKLRKPVPERGYTFEIRRKGKWQRAKLPFAFATEAGAEAMAQEKVLKEAAASYKVVKARKGKRVVRSRKKPSMYRKVLFRPGKEPGVMVQKKKLRILTPGEKAEISYVGGLARMKKSKLLFSQPKRIKLKRGTKVMAKRKVGRPKKKKVTRKRKKR